MLKSLSKTLNNNIWLKVLIIFLVWRLLILFISGYSISKIHRPDYQNPIPAKSFLLQGSLQWDSKYYLQIANSGYGDDKSALQVFFPLYPSILKASKAVSIDPIIAGTVVNFLAGYFAVYFLYLIALEFFKKNHSKALKTILLFLFFPTAFFLSAFYTEALFCALAFGAFHFAIKQKWLAANLLLMFLSALRLPGVVVAAAVFIQYLSTKKFQFKNLDRNIFWFLLAPLGIVAYMFLLNKNYHDPLLFQHAYQFGFGHDRFSLNIFNTIYLQLKEFGSIIVGKTDAFSSERLFDGLVFFGSWLLALIVFIKGRKKLPASYLFLGLASLVLFLLKGNFISVNRYILPLFPLYLILVDWTSEKEGAYYILLASSAAVMAFMLTLFSSGFWVG